MGLTILARGDGEASWGSTSAASRRSHRLKLLRRTGYLDTSRHSSSRCRSPYATKYEMGRQLLNYGCPRLNSQESGEQAHLDICADLGCLDE